MQRFFPILDSLKNYSPDTFRADLFAGLTVGIMLVPQGMAYAFLAGMPPVYGLYAALVPIFIYAFLGTSRQLAVGPVAVSSLLVLGGISELAPPYSAEFVSLVITCGLIIGLMEVLLSALRLGFLVNFLSHPVIAGFTSAAAVIIGISQLKDVLGFDIPRGQSVLQNISYAVENIAQTDWLTVMVSFLTIIFIYGMKHIKKQFPGALLVVILFTLLCWFCQWHEQGLAIVGKVPEGLPNFQLPDISWSNIQKLLPTAMTVTIIGLVESLGIAKVLNARHQDYELVPNRELLALGAAKIGGAFFQALPISGSFTRSAINSASGARTTVASLVTMFLVAITLLFFTPLFYYLPKAVLAGIILLAVKSLFDYKEAIHLWHTHRHDFAMMLITFLITLLVSIPAGILTGVLLSSGASLYRSSRPHIALLGRIPGTTHFRNLERFPNAKEIPGTLILRFDDQLYFANAGFFKETVKRLVHDSERSLQYFYLDASNIHDIDSTGLHALKESFLLLKKQSIQLCICSATGPVRDLLARSGLMEQIGLENNFVYVHTAQQFHEKEHHTHDPVSKSLEKDALQTNFTRNRRIFR